MDVVFKNMSNKTISIQVDPNDKLESVVSKLLEQNEIDPEKNTIKFIFKGRVLNNSSSFQEFKDEQNLTIIYMVSKNKSEIKTIISNKSVTEVKIEPVQETYTNTIKENWHQEFTTGENANEVDRLRASVIATLFFIRQSPQFTELFMDNFTTLLDFNNNLQAYGLLNLTFGIFIFDFVFTPENGFLVINREFTMFLSSVKQISLSV